MDIGRLRDIFLYEEVAGVGVTKARNLLYHFESFAAAQAASDRDLQQAGLTAYQVGLFRQAVVTGCLADRQLDFIDKTSRYKIVTIFDEAYPANLKNIYDPPLYLYYEGKAPQKSDDYTLGVVGSRKVHSNSIKVIDQFCQEIAGSGLVIASGLAMGVDSIAHMACARSGKRTVAVLGCGIDKQHNQTVINVRDKIVESGGTVYSSFAAGTTATHYTFPCRNRIISGLSLGVLVAEAREGSGSLITANFALDQGREVFALPNQIYNEKFIGSNNLIKNGQAKLVSSLQDILDELPSELKPVRNSAIAQPQAEIVKPAVTFSCKEEEKIYRQIADAGQLHIDQLAENLGFETGTLLSNLMMMELKKMIRRENGNFFSLQT